MSVFYTINDEFHGPRVLPLLPWHQGHGFGETRGEVTVVRRSGGRESESYPEQSGTPTDPTPTSGTPSSVDSSFVKPKTLPQSGRPSSILFTSL